MITLAADMEGLVNSVDAFPYLQSKLGKKFADTEKNSRKSWSSKCVSMGPHMCAGDSFPA